MSYFDLVAADYRDTLILFVLGAIFVALAMRIIKHALFDNIECWVDKKVSEDTDRMIPVFNTIKAVLCTVISAAACLAVIICLMNIAKFPCDNNKALLPFYVVPFYFLQLFLDLKGLKFITNRLFCVDSNDAADSDVYDESHVEEKRKFFKVKGRKYTEGENGTLIPVEE